MNTLGDAIKSLRERKNLTQSALGELVGGKSYQLVQRWESNRGKPTTEQLPLIAEALDIPLIDLLNLLTKPVVQMTERTPPRKSTSRSVDIPYLEDVTKSFPVKGDLVKPGNEYAVVTVTDRAMEPQLQKGSALLIKQIDNAEMPHELDGVYTLRCADRLLVRRIEANELRQKQQLTLLSDNAAYESITLSGGDISGMWAVLTILEQPVK